MVQNGAKLKKTLASTSDINATCAHILYLDLYWKDEHCTGRMKIISSKRYFQSGMVMRRSGGHMIFILINPFREPLYPVDVGGVIQEEFMSVIREIIY